ncbi:MAG: DUF3102 domain-containing protein [Rhizonema sp. PD37]|nr:DUF3102 domain-containing protein [Rhizonema sp. PD37]
MNHNNLPSKLLKPLPSGQIINFEYSFLEAQTRKIVLQRTNEIKVLMRRTAQDIIDIGQRLIEVKQHLEHGNFRNWLKFEFNWSVSAATKFMQVALQFKCIKLTHLNLTASTLYLIAAPSTPEQVRKEVIERASNGENISYNKAKAIVSQRKKTKKKAVESKTASLKPDEPVNAIESTSYETTSAISAQEDLTGKDVSTEETCELSSLKSLPSFALEDKQIASTIKCIPDNLTQTPINIENLIAISHKTSDAAISEIAISIRNLTAEELTRVIIKAVKIGLSEYHLSTIIAVSQQVLNTESSETQEVF